MSERLIDTHATMTPEEYAACVAGTSAPARREARVAWSFVAVTPDGCPVEVRATVPRASETRAMSWVQRQAQAFERQGARISKAPARQEVIAIGSQ